MQKEPVELPVLHYHAPPCDRSVGDRAGPHRRVYAHPPSARVQLVILGRLESQQTIQLHIEIWLPRGKPFDVHWTTAKENVLH